LPRITLTPATRGNYQKTVNLPADEFGKSKTDPPDTVDQGNVTLYAFIVDTSKMTYKFPIPADYAGGDMVFYIIWTNDGDVDDNGLNVKWQLDYQVSAEGDVIDGDHANSPKSVEDTDTSDLGWVEHHSEIMTIGASDFDGKVCILLKLMAVTPVGTPLTCDPHLMGMCYSYKAVWGRKG